MKSLIACAVAALVASPAFAAPKPQSTGDAFVAHIVSTGVATDAGPFAHVAGSGSLYNNSATGAPLQEVIALLPLNPTPSLYLNLGAVKASAANPGIGIDSEAWGSKAQVDSVNAAINLNPLPPGPVPQPFLNIVAGNVKADAGMIIVFPSSETASGSAKISHLTISGSALGATVVHFNGVPTVNKVIYDSPTVTITLNERTLKGVITCPPCMFTPYGIETDAVDIALNKAPWHGNKYSGHIIIGRATAGQ